MNLVCMSCYHEFEGSISYDELGWHSTCPECGCSFDVELPSDKIVMVFADNSSEITADIRLASFISYYAFSTREEFLRKWEEIVYNEKPDSMWYWVFEEGLLITFGCPCPDDVELICEAWDLEVDGSFDAYEWLKEAYNSCGVNVDEH